MLIVAKLRNKQHERFSWRKELLFGMHDVTVALKTMKLWVNMSELQKKVYMQIEAGVAPTVITHNIGIARSTVYNIKKLFQETGDFVRCMAGSGRPHTTHTKAMVASVKVKIEENPRNNVLKIARELEVDKSTVSHVVRADLGLKSCAVAKVQLLTAVQQRKRLQRCKLILNELKRGKDKVLIFSD